MSLQFIHSAAKRSGKRAWMELQVAFELAKDDDGCVVVVERSGSQCRRHDKPWPHDTPTNRGTTNE